MVDKLRYALINAIDGEENKENLTYILSDEMVEAPENEGTKATEKSKKTGGG